VFPERKFIRIHNAPVIEKTPPSKESGYGVDVAQRENT